MVFTKNFDIVCFGSAVVDTYVKIPIKEDKGILKIPCGSKMLVEDLIFDIGGGGTNTAVAFSRLGFKTGYVGKIGNDKNGEQILDLLEKENVEFIGRKVNEKTSGFSVILTGGGRNRSILTYKGINDSVEYGDFSTFKSKWIYLSSMMGKSFRTQIELAKVAKKNGIKIAYNPSEYLIEKENVKELIKYVDVLILNDVEATLLTKKKSSNDKLKKIFELMGGKNKSAWERKIVVITNEEKPVVAYDGFKFYKVAPEKIKVVERTGAGDAFAAGFVASLMVNKGIEECIKFGNREARSVLKHFGAKNDLLRINLADL